ncbi:MAG: citrate lyase holo-[acyl-carrier protein] synthase [Treponema sp.]|nr:citrate lyase holo-[acyl-carrier protein] synthase [Treponema sp.]
MHFRNVTVADMASAREARAKKQAEFLNAYRLPLVCFSLNIPGSVKTNRLYEWAFEAGVVRIHAACLKNDFEIASSREVRIFTGYEYYAAIHANVFALKEAMVQIEEADALGRIFDIDVLAPISCKSAETINGNRSAKSNTTTFSNKITRAHIDKQERTCLLCNGNAHECARSRAHSVTELVAAIDTIIRQCRTI